LTEVCISCRKPVEKVEEGFFDTRFGIDSEYAIGRCPSCALEQTVPVPSQDELKNLYENYYNFSGEKNTFYTRLRERFLFSGLYAAWTAIDGDISFHRRKGRGRLIDIGCNEGRGLEICRRNGFAPEGFELNRAAAAVAKAKGFSVFTDKLEDRPGDFYDVALLSNVLEHSPDPKAMLAQVRRLLKPGGQVWISCPNRDSWLCAVFGRYWINWHVPFHISHFSPATVKSVLEGSGFKVTGIVHETPALWVAHSILARLFARKGRPTGKLRNPVVVASLILAVRGFSFPFLWLGNSLKKGDCLVVTAEKV